jgi:hypothetical protein
MNQKELDLVEADLVSKIKRLIPLIRWVIAGAIGITSWVVTIQLTILRHEHQMDRHEVEIRALERNESSIQANLEAIKDSLDKIDKKLDR